jgi:FtsZ-binding cell division protein ZapB
MMIEMQIEILKEKLNRLVDEGLHSNEVYELSTKLDKLIVEYYVQERLSAVYAKTAEAVLP